MGKYRIQCLQAESAICLVTLTLVINVYGVHKHTKLKVLQGQP
jgi:hypothetical protein